MIEDTVGIGMAIKKPLYFCAKKNDRPRASIDVYKISRYDDIVLTFSSLFIIIIIFIIFLKFFYQHAKSSFKYLLLSHCAYYSNFPILWLFLK